MIMMNNKWNTTSSTYDSLSEFHNSPTQSSLVSFPDKRGRFDFLIKAKERQPLIVFFNAAFTGAQQRNNSSKEAKIRTSPKEPASTELRLPSFSGHNLLEQVGSSYICVNDPSLYLSERLKLAWYLGAEEIYAQQVIVQVLRKVVGELEPTRLIFVGGSGGGYAAMYYSSFFSESLALPWNPQTDVFQFIPDSVTNYLRHAWGFEGSLEEGKKYLDGKIDTDLFSRYTRDTATPSNYLIYLQNATDHHHIESHLKPFLSNLGIQNQTEFVQNGGDLSHRRHLKIVDTGSGHAAPSFASLVTTLSNLITTTLTWNEIFTLGKIHEFVSIRGR